MSGMAGSLAVDGRRLRGCRRARGVLVGGARIPCRRTSRSIPEGGLSMDPVTHQFQLAARPVGLPKPSDWHYAEEPVREPGDGEVLVKIQYIGLEPAMRGWMNDSRSYIAPDRKAS